MKSWDYIDPKLAEKYAKIHSEIAELKLKRKEMSQNPKLTKAGK